MFLTADRSVPPAPAASASAASPLSTSAILRYLAEALTADPLALPVLGLKGCIKGGAALRAGLENVAPGPVRRLAGCYVLYACVQLDTLVDELPGFEQAVLVHRFVEACITRARPLSALVREVGGCRALTPRERLRTVLLLRNLHWLVRSTEARLESPERLAFFREKLSGLIAAVVEDMNLEARARDTLSTLAPEYPAMGLSGLEVLWLLQGRPLEEIRSFRPVFSLAEQLGRLEDDILEVWKALRSGGDADAVEGRVDRRNLVLRHTRNLHWSLRAAMEEACGLSGRLQARLEEALGALGAHPLAPELRRVVTFFPSFVDILMGPHRVPPPAATAPESLARSA